MRRARHIAAAVTLLTGCSSGRSFLEVVVDTDHPGGFELKRLEVVLSDPASNATASATFDNKVNGVPTPFSIPSKKSFSLSFAPDRTGELDVSVTAVATDDSTAGRKTKRVTIVPGGVTMLEICISCSADLADGGSDGGEARDAAPVDLARVPDLGADLLATDLVATDLVAIDQAAADLAVVDLAGRDLARSDLARVDLTGASDLAVADLAVDDLAASDLATSDEAAPPDSGATTDLAEVDLLVAPPDLVAQDDAAEDLTAPPDDLSVAHDLAAADLASRRDLSAGRDSGQPRDLSAARDLGHSDAARDLSRPADLAYDCRRDGSVSCISGTCDPATGRCVACLSDGDCPPGQLCSGSSCVPGCNAAHACPSSEQCCNAQCIPFGQPCTIVGGCLGIGCISGQTCCGKACTDTTSDSANCGGCGMSCSAPHATPGCASSQCIVASCSGTYGDCNGQFSDGCEVDLSSDASNCGTCGKVCTPPPNTLMTCSGGACHASGCVSPYSNCDGNTANGCETNLSNDTANCGGCGIVCSSPPHTLGVRCTSGMCGYAFCEVGHDDCNGVVSDGCEVDVNNDTSNCGGCGIVCGTDHNSPSCTSGSCVDSCDVGWGDCNGDPADGCETDLSVDGSCGACNVTCNAGASCTNLQCVVPCGLKINEIYGGLTGLYNGFIEIHNNCPSTSAFLVAGKLVYRDETNNGGAANPDAGLLTGINLTVAAGGYALLCQNGYTGTGCSGVYSTQLPARGAIGIRTSTGVLLDSVGFGLLGAPNNLTETASAPALTIAAARSVGIGRDTAGDDTNDNSADFTSSRSSSPLAPNP